MPLFSSVELQPGYIPATKTSGRRRLVLRSTTRPSTENTREVATSELLAFCSWLEVIATLAHGGYPGLPGEVYSSITLEVNFASQFSRNATHESGY